MQFPAKDPADVVDESFDWTAFLKDGETITAASITVSPSGQLTATSAQIASGIVSTRVSGGVAGRKYDLTCQITTSSGNTVNRKASLAVRDL